MPRISETCKIVPLLSSADIVSGHTLDSFNMKDHGHATVIFTFGPSLSGNAALTTKQGATDGATTANLGWDYAYTSTSIGSDGAETLGTFANDSDGAITLTGTTYVSKILVIEINNKSLTDGYDWVTFVIDSSASAGELTVVAVLSEPRYASDSGETVLS